MAVNYREAIVHMALSQVGNEAPTGDDKYIEFYNSVVGTNFGVNSTAWCAIFVSYCARHVGVPTSVIPNFASCTVSRDSFWKPRNRYIERKHANPQPGDIIYFDWAGTTRGQLDHVGIVIDVTGSEVITVEGNTKGGYSTYGVRKKSYPKNWSQIAGYGIPDYDQTGGSIDNTDDDDNTYTKYVKQYQEWVNNEIDAGLIIDGSFGPLTRTAAVKMFQTLCNRNYNAGLEVDGSYGPATKSAARAIKRGAKGDFVKCAQGLLYGHDINPNGFDGSFGAGMLSAVKNFQRWAGISVDGSCGQDTWYNLHKKW